MERHLEIGQVRQQIVHGGVLHLVEELVLGLLCVCVRVCVCAFVYLKIKNPLLRVNLLSFRSLVSI